MRCAEVAGPQRDRINLVRGWPPGRCGSRWSFGCGFRSCLRCALHISRVVTRVRVRVEDQSTGAREVVGHNAQSRWATVQTPIVLFAIVRIGEEALVLTLESRSSGTRCGGRFRGRALAHRDKQDLLGLLLGLERFLGRWSLPGVATRV